MAKVIRSYLWWWAHVLRCWGCFRMSVKQPGWSVGVPSRRRALWRRMDLMPDQHEYRNGADRLHVPFNPNVCAVVCGILPELTCELAYDHEGPHRHVVEWR